MQSRTEPWNQITVGISMAGVIDRDFRSDDQIKQFTTRNILPLQLHEVESFLCLPEVLSELLSKKYADSNRPDFEALLKTMKQVASANINSTALRRATEHIKEHLSLSTPSGEEMAKLNTTQQSHALLTDKRKDLLTYLDGLDPIEIFDKEQALLEQALASDDWTQILALFDGKRLVQPICGVLKVGDAGHLLKEVIHHCPDPVKFPMLADLRESIVGMFPSSNAHVAIPAAVVAS